MDPDQYRIHQVLYVLRQTRTSGRTVTGDRAMNSLDGQSRALRARKYMLSSKSFWHAYLEMLPSMEEIGASFTWPEEDLKLLDGSLIKNMSRILALQ